MTPEEILKTHIKKTDTIILGVSGGADSIYLLTLCKKLNINTIVAHIDHNIRKESKKDALFVKKVCKTLNTPIETITLKPITKGNLEEKFREKRYQFFEKLRKKHKAKWILTAHHLNDNIETILFNLTRGTSLEGLTGIKTTDKNRKLLRPLLFMTKQQITNYLTTNKIKWIEDKTNKQTKYSRNRIRQNIIPELKQINPNLEKTFTNTIENLKELNNYINKKTTNWLKRNLKNNTIELSKFKKLDSTLQKKILAKIWIKFYKNTDKFNTNHLKQILKIIKKAHSNKKKEFGNTHFIAITKQNNKKYINFN